MKFLPFAVALPALLLAACNSGTPGAGDANGAAPAAPVAATKPPAGQNWVDVVSRTPEGGYVMGNPNAPVKLIEYGARTCPHCALFDAEGLPALKSGPIAAGKLSYEFRDFPVHGPLDMGPILLGQCVEPAQFFPMLDAMMANQQSLIYRTDKIPAEDQAKLQTASPAQVAQYLAKFYGYIDFVKQRGVTDAKAQACLANQPAIEAIAKGADTAGQQYQINSTPSFILNGAPVDLGADPDWAHLKPKLEAAGVM